MKFGDKCIIVAISIPKVIQQQRRNIAFNNLSEGMVKKLLELP